MLASLAATLAGDASAAALSAEGRGPRITPTAAAAALRASVGVFWRPRRNLLGVGSVDEGGGVVAPAAADGAAARGLGLLHRRSVVAEA